MIVPDTLILMSDWVEYPAAFLVGFVLEICTRELTLLCNEEHILDSRFGHVVSAGDFRLGQSNGVMVVLIE